MSLLLLYMQSVLSIALYAKCPYYCFICKVSLLLLYCKASLLLRYMQSVLIMLYTQGVLIIALYAKCPYYCFVCKVSLLLLCMQSVLINALYAKCPYYCFICKVSLLLLYLQSGSGAGLRARGVAHVRHAARGRGPVRRSPAPSRRSVRPLKRPAVVCTYTHTRNARPCLQRVRSLARVTQPEREQHEHCIVHQGSRNIAAPIYTSIILFLTV